MRTWTGEEFVREANRLANVLTAMGLMRGERVALALPLGFRAAVALQACRQMGVAAMLLDARAGESDEGEGGELAALLGGVRVAVAEGALLARLARAHLADLRFLIDAGAPGSCADARVRTWDALLAHAAPTHAPAPPAADEAVLISRCS